MFEFFDYLVNVITSAVDYFVSTLSMILEVILLMAKAVGAVGIVITFMPPIFQAVAGVVIAYAIVVNIIHFGG